MNICYSLPARKALFDSLGGINDTTVQNREWLYMLHEDTRQSLAIEGYFASEEDLERVLAGAKTSLEISNYFRTAQTVYDQALQYYRDNAMPPFNVSLIRHIHSELFRGIDNRRGDFRKEAIRIQGAKVVPPSEDVEDYLRASFAIIVADLSSRPFLDALSRSHALFESIHPFFDGNGRTGRIFLNYIAVSQGYPPIIIKGDDQAERNRYYMALEQADSGFHSGFAEPTPVALHKQLARGNFASLQDLLCDSLLPQLNQLTIINIEKQEPLVDIATLSQSLNVKEGTLRQWVSRGKMLAVKRGNRLYSHPRLVLPE
jgi:fido (protein-threonine AMPylation protein)